MQCSDCLDKVVYLGSRGQKACENCYNFCAAQPEFQGLEKKISELHREVQQLALENLEIDSKRKEALEKLRSLNLTYSRLEDDWTEKNLQMAEEIEKKKSENAGLENHCKELFHLKEANLKEIQENEANVLMVNQEIEECKIQNAKDIERIHQLEVLIEEQIEENQKIEESLRNAELEQKENEETMQTDESGLYAKLNRLKDQSEEMRLQNETLKKKVKELKKEENEDSAHPRVSIESRGESYKLLMEQWNSQEIQLKQLRLQIDKPPLVQGKCNCLLQ